MYDREQLLLEGYGDYRESIGRPRVNSLEDIEQSIPFQHFIAGYLFALKVEYGEVKEEDAEDLL